MSTNSQDQEIDLGQIGIGIKNFFNGIVNSLFDFIFFLKKKIIIIGLLFLVGIVIGFLLDKKHVFVQDITVIPNFGSNEYLYKKIEFLNSRIVEKDEEFFKSIGVSNSQNLGKLEIKAINGIFGFVNMRNNEQNFELIKLMAEDGNIEEIIKNDVTSKHFYLHNITFKTYEKVSQKELIDPILNYFQENSFYQRQQKIYQDNIDEKIKFNDSLITQIDGLIIKLSSNNQAGSSVSISENKGISELINKKDELIKETQYLKINKHEYEDIVKVQNISLNNVSTKGLNKKMKFILPILFVFLYLGFYKFYSLYKKQLARVR
ncbi:MAG: hypothetical protein NWP90_00295 [Flavobacterium sp.]|nr:hypothetical protein [Flavobacterium sp.]